MPYRLSVLFLAFTACAAPSAPRSTPVLTLESAAQCLARKGARLYGASWCPPCHAQLDLYGAEAAQVPYTDCAPAGQTDFLEACSSIGISFDTVLPVWIFEDGSRLYGVRHPDVIAAVADCPYVP